MTARAILLVALLLSACSDWKPSARAANDVARDLCALFYSRQQSISIDQAAAVACRTRDQIDPWLREVLALQRDGVAR